MRVQIVAHPRHHPRHCNKDDYNLITGNAYPRRYAILEGEDNDGNGAIDGRPLTYALPFGDDNGKQRVKFSSSTRSST